MGKAKLIVVGAVVAASLGAPSEASAVGTAAECQGGRVCIYGNNDFVWEIGNRPAGKGNQNLKGDENNQLDSWRNLTTKNARGYDEHGGDGLCHNYPESDNDNNVAPWNSDQVSSWYTNGACG